MGVAADARPEPGEGSLDWHRVDGLSVEGILPDVAQLAAAVREVEESGAFLYGSSDEAFNLTLRRIP